MKWSTEAMRNEIILAFWKDMQKDPPDMGYAKEIVKPLVEEIIRLKGLMPPGTEEGQEDVPEPKHADWCIGGEKGPCNCGASLR